MNIADLSLGSLAYHSVSEHGNDQAQEHSSASDNSDCVECGKCDSCCSCTSEDGEDSAYSLGEYEEHYSDEEGYADVEDNSEDEDVPDRILDDCSEGTLIGDEV
jgi:dissimilatory sulfite reductase (desulfoviridin) alpha/beta subunit